MNLNANNTKILICCHKKTTLPKDDLFMPIQVGAEISDVNLDIQRDDKINGMECDNISSKNKSFCELTALYWAWKNIKKLYPNLDYIGINHYRRYFDFNKKSFADSIIYPEHEVLNYKININKIERILLKNDLIISKNKIYPYSLFVNYSVCHYSDDFYTLQKVIDEKYNDYSNSFRRVCFVNNKISPYNLMIMSWKDFDNYCSWLFDILFECEKRINISNYSSIQKRIFGYMAERLLNVWIYHNYKKAKLLNVALYSDVKNKQTAFQMLKDDISFNLSLDLYTKISNLLRQNKVFCDALDYVKDERK